MDVNDVAAGMAATVAEAARRLRAVIVTGPANGVAPPPVDREPMLDVFGGPGDRGPLGPEARVWRTFAALPVGVGGRALGGRGP